MVFYLSLSSVHKKSPPLVYSFPMYSAISLLTYVKRSVHGLAESKTRTQPLRPLHVLSNLGVDSVAPNGVFVGTVTLDFCSFW